MESYLPPYTISNQMLTLVAQIAEKTGRVSHYRSFETKPRLRRNNRIRSIHSSLAIEAKDINFFNHYPSSATSNLYYLPAACFIGANSFN